ncbi:MAG: hypothetical protein C0399_11250 [Syntrophus sp. (in: bacteria)]|nr:hypothetical protein [Syntrophus sp. (in: bacteria)]
MAVNSVCPDTCPRISAAIIFICLMAAMLFFISVTWARAEIDCPGSLKAYAIDKNMKNYDCDCSNGNRSMPVCKPKSGLSKKSSSGSKSGSLSTNNQIKLQLFQGVLDGLMQEPGNNAAAQQQKEAQQEAERQQQFQKAQKQKLLEFEQQKNFAEKKDQLLGTLKGTSTGTLGLKTLYDKGTQDSAPVDLTVLKEQDEFENMNAGWMKKQNQLIEQRLVEPNKYASAIYNSLTTNAPPMPWKTFNELQSGDVLLIKGKLIAAVDNTFSSWDYASETSHTVLYLKEVNGKKLFLDNQPFEGPRIISEDEFLKRYIPRGAEVAKLAQPLNEKEGKRLFTAAVELAQKNNKKLVNEDTWFGKYPSTDTNYGAWGKDNVVCSESDWALINNAGRNIPKSDDKVKVKLGVDFSPADYKNSPYFLVTPFW